MIRIMFQAIDYCHSRNIVHRDLTVRRLSHSFLCYHMSRFGAFCVWV